MHNVRGSESWLCEPVTQKHSWLEAWRYEVSAWTRCPCVSSSRVDEMSLILQSLSVAANKNCQGISVPEILDAGALIGCISAQTNVNSFTSTYSFIQYPVPTVKITNTMLKNVTAKSLPVHSLNIRISHRFRYQSQIVRTHAFAPSRPPQWSSGKSVRSVARNIRVAPEPYHSSGP